MDGLGWHLLLHGRLLSLGLLQSSFPERRYTCDCWDCPSCHEQARLDQACANCGTPLPVRRRNRKKRTMAVGHGKQGKTWKHPKTDKPEVVARSFPAACLDHLLLPDFLPASNWLRRVKLLWFRTESYPQVAVCVKSKLESVLRDSFSSNPLKHRGNLRCGHCENTRSDMCESTNPHVQIHGSISRATPHV